MHPDTNRPQTPPHLNALKHGLRAATVLLPGEDAEEFHAMRQELFALHNPRTRTETRCVEAMVEHEWSMARCRRIRERYQGRLLGLVEQTGEAHCEKDPHRWHHSAMDCSLDERRIAKLIDWQLERLTILQKLRHQRLLARLDEQTGQEDALAPVEVMAPAPQADDTPATASTDDGNRKTRERTSAAPAVEPTAPRAKAQRAQRTTAVTSTPPQRRTLAGAASSARWDRHPLAR